MTTKSAVLFALFLAVFATPLQAEEIRYENLKVSTIQSTGPAAQRADIVFVSEGFLADQHREYDAQVRSCLNILWSVSPFKELKDKFNVHVVYVDALRGTGYDSRGKRQIIYPFGSEYSGNTSSVRLTKSDKVRVAAANAPGADYIIVISTLAGRSHAGGMVVLAGDHAALPHEFGHLIGGLGDEYSSRSQLRDRDTHVLPSGRDLHYPNLQVDSKIDTTNSQSIQKTAKWGHFLDLPDADPIVSAYQGGYYRDIGVWRPSYSCIMRSSQGAIFCPVCHEELYKAILQKCRQPFAHEAYHRKFPLKNWKTKMY